MAYRRIRTSTYVKCGSYQPPVLLSLPLHSGSPLLLSFQIYLPHIYILSFSESADSVLNYLFKHVPPRPSSPDHQITRVEFKDFACMYVHTNRYLQLITYLLTDFLIFLISISLLASYRIRTDARTYGLGDLDRILQLSYPPAPGPDIREGYSEV